MITKEQADNWISKNASKSVKIFNSGNNWDKTKGNLEHAIHQCGSTGLFCEFGVRDLRSFKAIRQLLHSDETILHGFDTFEGLPEPWELKKTYAKGILKAKCVPESTHTERFYKGLFSERIPDLLSAHGDDIAFCHVDGDLYSSCNDVLYGLDERIVPGTILVFDELHAFESADLGKWHNLWNHECRSLMEWCSNNNRKVEMFSRTDWTQASFVVVK